MTFGEMFNRDELLIRPLSERAHDLTAAVIMNPGSEPPCPPEMAEPLGKVAERMLAARRAGAAVVFMLGGHVVRSGVQRYLIDLMERGLISLLAMNGSVVIHDYEMALIGATTESVARYIQTGEFGLWKETGAINDIINRAWRDDPKAGLAQSVGRAIAQGAFPHADGSILAAAHRLGVPATAHIGIGYDIIHEHPNCDGAATGALSYNDFLRFAQVMDSMNQGVLANFGSAVMGPEVFLKALSMARNRARQKGREIRGFTTLVCDLRPLPEPVSQEPTKQNPDYYFRPWKTLLVRTVADGGKSYYIRGSHAQTIPGLWRMATQGSAPSPAA